MSSFTDFLRGRKEPRRELDPRGQLIRMTCLEEGFDGYEKTGVLKGALAQAPTLTERDTIELVLGAVSTAFHIPTEQVLETTDIRILLSSKTGEGEIFAKRKESQKKEDLI